MSWTGVEYCLLCWVDDVICVQLHGQLHRLGGHRLWYCGEIRVGEVNVWLNVELKCLEIGVLYRGYRRRASDS